MQKPPRRKRSENALRNHSCISSRKVKQPVKLHRHCTPGGSWPLHPGCGSSEVLLTFGLQRSALFVVPGGNETLAQLSFGGHDLFLACQVSVHTCHGCWKMIAGSPDRRCDQNTRAKRGEVEELKIRGGDSRSIGTLGFPVSPFFLGPRHERDPQHVWDSPLWAKIAGRAGLDCMMVGIHLLRCAGSTPTSRLLLLLLLL